MLEKKNAVAASVMNRTNAARVAALSALVLVAGSAAADQGDTVRADTVATEKFDGATMHSVATLNVGAKDGVVPGAKAHFRDANGGKLVDFTIERVTSQSAFGLTPLSIGELNRLVPAAVVSTRKCHHKGAKPDYKDPDVALGKTPPPGFLFAKIVLASTEQGSQGGETVPSGGLRLQLDKGFDDQVLPGAAVYVVMPGMGTPYVGAGSFDLKWATASKSGGHLKGFVGTAEAWRSKLAGQRVAIERVHCAAP